jgi:hypothetical protein
VIAAAALPRQVLGSMCMLCAWLAAAAQEAPAEALARRGAWDLAILSERLGKLHAQAGQGLLAERARRGLTEGSRQFDALLRSTAAAATPEARDSYLLLGLLWKEYRPWIARPATRESARREAERTAELAWVAVNAARAWPARSPSASLAAEAAHASVLAQRVARLQLLRRWDVRDDAASRELDRASRQLGATLARLSAEAGNDAEIAAELQVAQNQHVFMERAAHELAAKPALAAPLEIVAKTGDNILESLQRVARLYEARELSATLAR